MKKLLQEVLERGLAGLFPNITLHCTFFISLPASVASGERTFSVLKQIKNYYRSSVGQDRLNGSTAVIINCDLA
jgi:hypothetical protein